ncbi:hypothetical protein RISK_006446 [Rhodopirellula islandica]|uniref:Uncharacterized protein n=1 Tax=Rhodopirellula islandica TaxID=595434 RepID=A0A0J1B2Z9_RHOIS|nr:hypothetical protein RISK_006446 [Rhodopirellula islandica]
MRSRLALLLSFAATVNDRVTSRLLMISPGGGRFLLPKGWAMGLLIWVEEFGRFPLVT